MNFGKMLRYMSPAVSMMSGHGAGFLPYLSPGLGMLSGKGPFGNLLGGHHGQHDQQIDVTGLSDGATPFVPQMGQQQPRTGMFGSSPMSANPSMGQQPQQGGMDPRMIQYMMQMRGY